jgi:predicted component of type VI protein secretion system
MEEILVVLEIFKECVAVVAVLDTLAAVAAAVLMVLIAAAEAAVVVRELLMVLGLIQDLQMVTMDQVVV